MLRPRLAEHGVHLVGWEQLTEEQRAEVSEVFDHRISPVLTPLSLDAAHPFPYVSNLSTSWAFRLGDPVSGESVLVRVKVPRELSQWLRVRTGVESAGRVFVGLDEVIAANAQKLFPGMEIESASQFRVCRDAEVEVDDDDGLSKRAMVERELQQRRFEPVVRLELQPNADPAMVAELRSRFALAPEDIYEMSALLDYTTLFEIAELRMPELRDPPWTPLPPLGLESADGDIFTAIRRGDVLHPPAVRQLRRRRRAVHPRGGGRPADRLDQDDRLPSRRRHAVRPVADPRSRGRQAGRLRDRAERPLRRGAEPALVARAREGRRARRLRAQRAEDAQPRPRSSSARKARRHPLLRARRDRQLPHAHGAALRGRRPADQPTRAITDDVVTLFHFLTGRSRTPSFSTLLVAPMHMRSEFVELIEREIEQPRWPAVPARIVCKMNQLEDPEMCAAPLARLAGRRARST